MTRTEDTTTRARGEPPFGSIIRDIIDSFRGLIRSEIHLAKAEARQSVQEVGRLAAFAILFGVIALAGILPLTAALVIALGNAMDGNYALSALIVGLVFTSVGTWITLRYAVRIKEMDLSLPRTRRSFRSEAEQIDQKLQSFKDNHEWRAS